ncbi:MAG TPA: DUF87 domain-containing protein, partial [Euzebya sp.]|nr:DUF87 domain-containing protein [Euzebya sp.]
MARTTERLAGVSTETVVLKLRHLRPDRDLRPDDAMRDGVALLTALEGHSDVRFALQIAAFPEPDTAERGRIEVHVLAHARSGGPSDLDVLADDLVDVLAAPPVRWTFDPVRSEHDVHRALHPLDPEHLAEIARREEPAIPLRWNTFGGFTRPSDVDRSLWTLWTFGPASPSLHRLASTMLAQSAPVVLRVVIAPTALTPEERGGIERLLIKSVDGAGGNRVLTASLHTLESLLYVRPLFDVRCLVASSAPLSRSLLSAVGHAISEPARHSAADHPVLTGGFAILRAGSDIPADQVRTAFTALEPGPAGPSIARADLARLRRLMGPWEAANAFRIPVTDDDFPGLDTLDIPDLEPPILAMARDGLLLGRTIGYGDESVNLAADDRERHLYVSGQTGTGKSTLLLNLAMQDIRDGRGLALIDPHGDLVEAILRRVPDDRVDDVVLIDPADEVAVVGVNLLEAESAVQQDYVVSELCNMFYALFDPSRQGIIGPRYESMLRAAALLLMTNPGRPSSLLDIPTVFTDKAVRTMLLQQATDPIVREYWEGEFAQTSDYHRSEVLGWFRSKFEVFRTSRLVRNVIGQSSSSVNFAQAMNEDRILLVNLSKGLLGEYNSALIGHIVFARIWAATLERASVPAEQRRPFSL